MPQNRESGATADDYGYTMARKIAAKLGATPVTDNSNEFALDGQLVTIRCAHSLTDQVGVLYSMLDRIDTVIGAFESETDIYLLYSMSPGLYRTQMRDSKGEGKVGLVRRKAFEKLGKLICTITTK